MNQHDEIVLWFEEKTHIDGVDMVVVGQVSNENKFYPRKRDKRMLKSHVKRKQWLMDDDKQVRSRGKDSVYAS